MVRIIKTFSLLAFFGVFSAVIIGCLSQLPKPLAQQLPQELLFISNVTIVDVLEEKQYHNMDVTISNGVIASIAANQESSPPLNAKTIDATGKYLIPAFWDMHVHTVSSSPQFHFPLYVANGVLNIRDMGDTCSWSSDLSCKSLSVNWRKEIESGTMLGPNIRSVASYHVEEVLEDEDIKTDEIAGEIRKLIQTLKERKDEVIKLQLGHDTPDELFEIILAESKLQNIPAMGHLPGNLDLHGHDLTNFKSVEHDRAFYPYCSNYSGGFEEKLSTVYSVLDKFDLTKCESYMRKIAESGTAYVPTHIASSFQDLMIFNELQDRAPGLEYVDKVTSSLWNAYAYVTQLGFSTEDEAALKRAHEYGLKISQLADDNSVNILAGTDSLDAFAVPGFSIHRELELLNQAGLPPFKVLQAGTINAARYYGLQNTHGSVNEGKFADLVLLDNNPLDDIKNTTKIDSVILNGRLYDKESLDNMKDYVLNNVNSYKTSTVLLGNLLF